MKIKAFMSIPSLSIVANAIYDTEFSEEYKKSLVKNLFAYEVKEDELNQTVIDDYVEKSYPNRIAVFKDGNIYRANVGDGNFTSNIWVESEWVLKVNGN